MKRFLAVMLMLVLFVGVFSSNTVAVTTPETKTDAVDPLSARLTHMLALNYNFDKDFKDDALIVEHALISLRDKADDDGFVKTDLVSKFISHMYGYEVDLTSANTDGMPKKDGYIWIVPKGFTSYSYTITGIEEYEGGLTATARVLSLAHDGEKEIFYITVDFIENNESCFGYNIASCVTMKDIGYRI